MWMQRGHLALSSDDSKGHASGAATKFTFRSVMMITVMGELVRMGETPRDAFEAVEHWMTQGVLEGQYGAPARREGGGLFPQPFLTYLIAGTQGAPKVHGFPCHIVGIDPKGDASHNKLFGALFAGARPSAKVIQLNLLDQQVKQICMDAILRTDRYSKEADWNEIVEDLLAADAAKAQ
jgi:hypothetical protein